MNRKSLLFKNVFYIFVALCLMALGATTLAKTQITEIVVAEDVSDDEISNTNIPEYFLAQEYLYNSSSSTSTENSSSLISDYNTFRYINESYTSNYLQLSLATNGEGVSENSLYTYVYYPDLSNRSTFYFYSINNVNLYINGEQQTINDKTFVTDTNLFFENYSSSLTLNTFSMVFDNSGTSDNAISILDSNGNVIEGVYQVSINMLLCVATDGTDNGSEELITEQTVTIDYYFYVVDNENYFDNNRPIVDSYSFDNEVTISSTTNQNAYLLYSNYTSKSGVGSSTEANQIPYIEYDYTRYEVTISKTYNNSTNEAYIQLDKDYFLSGTTSTSPVVVSGEDIVYVQVDTTYQVCRIYFTDVGQYTISLSAIKLVQNGDSAQKYSLDGLTSITRNVVVYMYGYQVGFTNYDGTADSNNNLPFGEMKTAVFEDDEGNAVTGYFTDSADITSSFVNSQTDYSQDSTSTFLQSNIVNFLNSQDSSGNYNYSIVKTNQTPVSFNSNATLVSSSSYVLSTYEMSGSSSTRYSLRGSTLYSKTFDGRTESVDGIYIYIIAYTFDNYYQSETYLNTSKVFYQVFCFEITKGTPSISVLSESGDEVYTSTYLNENVIVYDSTKNDPYNKEVTVQVYAYDYTSNSYLTGYGGESGISLQTLIENEKGSDNTFTLTANAHYTIRLYYTNELSSVSTNINSSNGYISQQSFTIDKIDISGVVGRNVSEVSSTSEYTILNNMSSFATNQSMVLAWDKKASGASTYAYYRYFALSTAQYYSTTSDSNVSTLLQNLLGQSSPVLPVNAILDLNGTNEWLPLSATSVDASNQGNTIDLDYGDTVSSDYVLSYAGLYIVDIYDEAGNHSIEIFFIDNTSPIFALFDGSSSTYTLTSTTMYITATSTLYWGDYKGIYITNFDSSLYTGSYNTTNLPSITTANDIYNFYVDHNGDICMEIYQKMYDELYYPNNHIQYLELNNTSVDTSSVSSQITSYTGMYMTIAINEISYYIDATHSSYTSQTVNHKEIEVEDTEFTYRVLIRDLSNTEMDLTLSETAVSQYTNYYSARQILIVSFDTSQFAVSFTNSDGEEEILTSNTTVEGTVEGDDTLRTKITYLNPSSLSTAFVLSFIPTSYTEDESLTIQVESVEIRYYSYVVTSTSNGAYYYELSSEYTTYTVYEYTGTAQTDTFTYDIGASNTQGITNAGMYEIVRTYVTGDGYTINTKDYYERTFVLYVDRNEVVTNSETVDDGHSESLVGGDIFVAMFDNGTSASLVVTFPNSDENNSDSQTIYNNGSSIQTILTTNKLPVSVYIPTYKYTTDVTKNSSTYSYNFEVNYDFETNEDGSTEDDMNYFIASNSDYLISEYVLYAEIYRGGTLATNLIATTSSNPSNPTIDSVVSENGFLVFFDTSGNRLNELTVAGEYYVIIYQGKFGIETGDNRYESSITFKFEIQSATPEFTVQKTNGESLYAESSSSSSYSTIYYTNQPELILTWDAATDKYMVEVDQITISTSNTTVTATRTTDDDGNEYWTTTDESIWSSAPQKQNSNSEWIATINLKALNGVYTNGGYVDITMQFKADENYYSPVTKRISIDLSAPNTTINTLVSNSTSGVISSLTESNLRTYLTAEFQSTTSASTTSYNISNSNDNNTFANYSYTVTSSFLQTLTYNKDYQTYIRKYVDSAGNNTKYTGSDSETYPTDFLASDFDGEISTISSLDANYYYEVVEMDRAGNMTIYTIYVVDYSSDCDIITYTDGYTGEETSYDTTDYTTVESYSGTARHNIYSRTGFSLTDINFFGDAWVQFTLTTYNARGDRTVQTLMLTPYDPGYAIAFSGTSTERIALSDLIDGSTGSVYKNCISVYNRQSTETENFYITIYNTSLSASLTEQQNQEYIRFSSVTDSTISSTTRASTYVSYMKITVDGSVIYEAENTLGYASIWASNAYIDVTSTTTYLTFQLSSNVNYSSNARVLYEYRDNYGVEYKEIHLYNETIISQEITSSGYLYSFYDDDEGIQYYITDSDFQYIYNPSKYTVEVYDVINGEISTSLEYATTTDVQNTSLSGTKVLTVTTTDEAPYNHTFVLQIYDYEDSDSLIKEIYFMLYNELPTANTTSNNNSAGQFKIYDSNLNNITSDIIGGSTTGYYTEVQIIYSLNEDNFIPVVYSISTDGVNWTEINSGTRLSSQTGEIEKYYLKIWYNEEYLLNLTGSTTFVFGNVPSSQIYEINLASLTTTYWVEKTVDGVTSIVDKSGQTYTSSSGKQYTNHYIVNIEYANKDAVVIQCSEEEGITATLQETFNDGSGVYSELYLIQSEDLSFSTNIVITYIPSSDEIVEYFYVSNLDGVLSSQNMISSTSYTLVVPEGYSLTQMEIRWSKYYGLAQNQIQITIIKDGIEFEPEIYTTTVDGVDYFYTYLTYSGKYIISFTDISGNTQTFNYGNTGQSKEFALIFLKDVPFTVTYTNIETGEEETTLPIKQAIYNGYVTLNIDSSTRSEFYMTSGYPTISVTKNGEEYDGGFSSNATTFTFTESGYYEVTFTATSKDSQTEIRQETYSFTIINEEEHKISYVYNEYSNYYVEKVEKDGVDITATLLKTLNVDTITVDGVEYMAQLPLSYLDEKTGEGEYVITINSNNKLLKNSSIITSFTFKVVIYQGTAPINISIDEGESTTSEITVTYNKANLYIEMGASTIRIVKYNDSGTLVVSDSESIDSTSTGEGSMSITSAGTYFVQILSPSGNLLFSYKVTKTDPMNAATIIIIVVSVLVVLVVAFLIFKLRKRISVK